MVELFQDLAIVLFSMFGILAMLMVAIQGLLLYGKVAPTLDSAKWSAKRTREATSQLSKRWSNLCWALLHSRMAQGESWLLS